MCISQLWLHFAAVTTDFNISVTDNRYGFISSMFTYRETHTNFNWFHFWPEAWRDGLELRHCPREKRRPTGLLQTLPFCSNWWWYFYSFLCWSQVRWPVLMSMHQIHNPFLNRSQKYLEQQNTTPHSAIMCSQNTGSWGRGINLIDFDPQKQPVRLTEWILFIAFWKEEHIKLKSFF